MSKRTIIAPESKKQRMAEIYPDSEPKETETAAHRRALQKYEEKQQFLYPVERIAQDKLVIRKTKFPGADEAYPDVTQSLFRFVDKFYPHAKGGPLWVDEPRNEKEIYRAYERHKVMKKLGLRHLVVEKDSTYEHLLEQLGESL
jgi:hypothetical protein